MHTYSQIVISFSRNIDLDMIKQEDFTYVSTLALWKSLQIMLKI